jgi:hypothetical protein
LRPKLAFVLGTGLQLMLFLSRVVVVAGEEEVIWYALGGSVCSGAVASVIIDAHGPSLPETFL